MKPGTLELENPSCAVLSLSFPVCKLKHVLQEVSVQTVEASKEPGPADTEQPPTVACTRAPRRCVQTEAGNVNFHRKKSPAEVIKSRISGEIILDEPGGPQIQ